MTTPDDPGFKACECFAAPPAPLGTTHPCGCVARAINIVCHTCGLDTWVGTRTSAEVGEQEHLHGLCPVCGADISGLVVVHKHPPPAIYRQHSSLN